MDLPRTGREYADWTWSADEPLDGVPEVCFLPSYAAPPTSTTPWVEAAWTGPAVPAPTEHAPLAERRTFTLLLAGPDAPAGGPTPVQLARGTHWCTARLRDNPEVIVRRAGRVVVD